MSLDLDRPTPVEAATRRRRIRTWAIALILLALAVYWLVFANEYVVAHDDDGAHFLVGASKPLGLVQHRGIGAHGKSHRFLEDLDQKDLEAELEHSRLRLSSITGCRIDALALPGGRGGERERLAASRHGYHHLFGSMPGANPSPADGNWWQRIAITRNTSLERFAELVQWQGLHPRLSQARFIALSWPKRLLGNAGYERLRARWLAQQ